MESRRSGPRASLRQATNTVGVKPARTRPHGGDRQREHGRARFVQRPITPPGRNGFTGRRTTGESAAPIRWMPSYVRVMTLSRPGARCQALSPQRAPCSDTASEGRAGADECTPPKACSRVPPGAVDASTATSENHDRTGAARAGAGGDRRAAAAAAIATGRNLGDGLPPPLSCGDAPRAQSADPLASADIRDAPWRPDWTMTPCGQARRLTQSDCSRCSPRHGPNRVGSPCRIRPSPTKRRTST